MKKLPKAIHIVGQVWIWLAIFWILLSYSLNLIFSKEPIDHRVLAFLNVWFVFIVLLIILPRYLLTDLFGKIANRSGDSFNRAIDGNESKIIPFLTEIFGSKIFFSLAAVGYLILMVFFAISHN
jgi:hypothetical protein